ncbi:unnamed protein product [Strongylus vulgaris]|uniref:Uncharacterized protein n=1 Tax=Strongylus vulgaris TaxID=40348 RepID=A0A3P7KNZ1_STRVU|nr:unnamed protein product [Strongylus vulgaris]
MHRIEGAKFHAICAFPLVISLLWTLTFAYATWLSRSTFKDGYEHPLLGRPELYSDIKNVSLTVSLISLVSLLLCALASMIISARLINSRIALMTDKKSKERQTRVLRLLIMQVSHAIHFLFRFPRCLLYRVLKPTFSKMRLYVIALRIQQ